MSCTKSVRTSSCGDARVATLFTGRSVKFCWGGVGNRWDCFIGQSSPNVCVVPEIFVAVREGEECVQDFLDQLSGEESAVRHFVFGGEADDNDSFVEIMSGITTLGDAESEGWIFADALARANLSVETLAEGVVDTSRLPVC